LDNNQIINIQKPKNINNIFFSELLNSIIQFTPTIKKEFYLKKEKNSENSNYFSESKQINQNTLINIVKKKNNFNNLNLDGSSYESQIQSNFKKGDLIHVNATNNVNLKSEILDEENFINFGLNNVNFNCSIDFNLKNKEKISLNLENKIKLIENNIEFENVILNNTNDENNKIRNLFDKSFKKYTKNLSEIPEYKNPRKLDEIESEFKKELGSTSILGIKLKLTSIISFDLLNNNIKGEIILSFGDLKYEVISFVENARMSDNYYKSIFYPSLLAENINEINQKISNEFININSNISKISSNINVFLDNLNISIFKFDNINKYVLEFVSNFENLADILKENNINKEIHLSGIDDVISYYQRSENLMLNNINLVKKVFENITNNYTNLTENEFNYINETLELVDDELINYVKNVKKNYIKSINDFLNNNSDLIEKSEFYIKNSSYLLKEFSNDNKISTFDSKGKEIINLLKKNFNQTVFNCYLNILHKKVKINEEISQSISNMNSHLSNYKNIKKDIEDFLNDTKIISGTKIDKNITENFEPLLNKLENNFYANYTLKSKNIQNVKSILNHINKLADSLQNQLNNIKDKIERENGKILNKSSDEINNEVEKYFNRNQTLHEKLNEFNIYSKKQLKVNLSEIVKKQYSNLNTNNKRRLLELKRYNYNNEMNDFKQTFDNYIKIFNNTFKDLSNKIYPLNESINNIYNKVINVKNFLPESFNIIDEILNNFNKEIINIENLKNILSIHYSSEIGSIQNQFDDKINKDYSNLMDNLLYLINNTETANHTKKYNFNFSYKTQPIKPVDFSNINDIAGSILDKITGISIKITFSFDIDFTSLVYMQYIKREVYLGTNFDLGFSLSCESSFSFLLFKIGFEIKGYLAKIKNATIDYVYNILTEIQRGTYKMVIKFVEIYMYLVIKVSYIIGSKTWKPGGKIFSSGIDKTISGNFNDEN